MHVSVPKRSSSERVVVVALVVAVVVKTHVPEPSQVPKPLAHMLPPGRGSYWQAPSVHTPLSRHSLAGASHTTTSQGSVVVVVGAPQNL